MKDLAMTAGSFCLPQRALSGHATLTREMTKVKICGLTRVEDAQFAVQQGAWALGMIMWPASPRHCEPQRAAEIADLTRRSAEVVGVFVDQTLDEVVNLTNEIGLSMVQLHGDEGLQFCKAVAQRTGARVTKSFRVKDRSVLGEMGKFYDVDFHLLDTYKAGIPGGTGEVFDWNFLAANPRRGNAPLILSGGLKPSNVAEAITQVRPFAVDVSSGVESEPGIKDHGKIAEFFAAVRSVADIESDEEAAPLTGADEEVLTLGFARRELAETAAQRGREAEVKKATEAAESEESTQTPEETS